MKYPYRVKHNGVWYDANTEIPENGSKQPVKTEAPKVVADEDVKPENEPKNEVNEGDTPCTLADLEEMSYADLKKVAKDADIKGFTTMSRENIKKALIAKFGL